MIRGAALGVRFGCELGALAALGYWGFRTGGGLAAWVLGIGAPVAAAVIWGAFVSPKARRPVSVPVRLLVELVVFTAAVVALIAADQAVLAIVLAVTATVTSLLNARPGTVH